MFSVYCEEKGGQVLRTIEPMTQDIWVIRDVVKKMRGVPNFLGSTEPYSLFLSSSTQMFLVDDVGIVGALDIRPGNRAHVNMTFWDRRLRGREALCRGVCNLLLKMFDLKMLYTGVKHDDRILNAFLKRVGLRRVNQIDEWFFYHWR